MYDIVAECDDNTDDVYTEIKTPPTNLRAGFAMNECMAYEVPVASGKGGVETGPK